MRKSLLIKSLLLSAVLLSSQAFAASTSFEDPASASWGGWNRGDANTTYVHWEVIDGIPYDGTPDAGNVGAAVSGLVTNNPGGFITGGGLGGNIYSFGDVPDFTIYTAPISSPAGPVTVAMQIANLGTDLDVASVTLSGAGAADSVTLLYSSAAGGAFGGTIFERVFVWTLASAMPGGYIFDFNALGSSMSLDAFSIDVGPAAVPVPAAVWLFGSALLGLVGVRRRPALVA